MMEWLDAGEAASFAEGGTRVEVGGRTIAVFRIGDGFYALEDRCSHADASLAEGDLYGRRVECPLHGAEFDLLTGEPLVLPAVRPVPAYQVRVSGGRLMIGVGDGEKK